MIESATQLLAVTTPELPAIKNLQLFLDLVQALELVSPDQISVVVNRANVPGGIPTQQIRTVLKVGEVYTVPDDPKLHAALVRGTLIVQEDANAPSTQATMKLSEAIWKKLSQPTPVS